MLRFLLRALVYATGFCAGFVSGVITVRRRGTLACTSCGGAIFSLHDKSDTQLIKMVAHAQSCEQHPLHEQCQPEPVPEPEVELVPVP